jgi:diguanylate cyclase (GGDEF)-like protein
MHIVLMLDINTVFVLIVLIGILIATILAVVGLGVDNSLIYWAGGYATQSLAFSLLAMRGIVPDLYSVLLANMLIAMSYALYAWGLLRFLKQNINPLVVAGPVLIVATVFPLLTDNLGTRILLIGVVNAFQSALIFFLLVRNSSSLVGRGKLILATAFAAGGIVALLRPLALLLDLIQIESVNSAGVFQNLTFAAVLLINIAIALGLVLMQKEQAESETAGMARTDELTGLPNRRSIYEKINQTLLDGSRIQTYSALMLIDLNNFKTVNDQFGHATGDELLRQAADRIRECLTNKDAAARLGGDEFVVLLSELAKDPESAERNATHRAKCVHHSLDQEYNLNQVTVHGCSGSIGLAIAEPGMTGRETLLREADQAMYRAKNSLKASIAMSSDQNSAQGTAVSSTSGVTVA